MKNTAILVIPLLLSLACSEHPLDQGAPGLEIAGDAVGLERVKRDRLPDNQKETEAWSAADRPTLFSPDLEYHLEDLPLEGEAEDIPWAGSYWPVYRDAINHRWAGSSSMSPSAKYGEAFGVENVEDLVSLHHGIDSASWRPSCTSNSDCETGEGNCAIREGEESGYCIPTWWGICHAWAPVAMMESEPIYPVTRNGVTFEVNDLKALLTLVYNNTGSRFVSLRCNEDDSADEIEYDAYDRPTGSDEECRDTNPGTYHVLLANYLGLNGETFIEDRTFDAEVWNQPIRGYRVTRQEEITVAQAHELLGVDDVEGSASEGYVEQLTAEVEEGAWYRPLAFEVQPGDSVQVELDGDGGDADLYVKFGDAPSATDYDCRPWASDSQEICTLTAAEGDTQIFVAVYGYRDRVSFDLVVTVGETGLWDGVSYRFGDHAETLYHVGLEVEFITESSSFTDGNLADHIDSYTRTDTYEYVLELDAQGRVNGGEWIGDSKSDHPDFLWLPVSRSDLPVAGGSIQYHEIASLLQDSLLEQDPESAGSSESGAVATGEWLHYGPYVVESGVFQVAMSGTGDPDLYVRRGSQPTSGSYDCRPYRYGAEETCSLEGAGSYYVSVRGYSEGSFSLVIELEDTESSSTDEWSESGTVAFGEWDHYGPFSASSGYFRVSMTGTGDPDLYVRAGGEPEVEAYDCRPYSSGGSEECVLEGPASFYVSVRGFSESTYSLEIRMETQENTASASVHLDESGALAQGEMQIFSLEVVAGQQVRVQTTAEDDVDLYLKLGAEPTTATYDARGYTSSGYESLDYTAASTGTLYVGVNGYRASSFTLVSQDL